MEKTHCFQFAKTICDILYYFVICPWVWNSKMKEIYAEEEPSVKMEYQLNKTNDETSTIYGFTQLLKPWKTKFCITPLLLYYFKQVKHRKALLSASAARRALRRKRSWWTGLKSGRRIRPGRALPEYYEAEQLPLRSWQLSRIAEEVQVPVHSNAEWEDEEGQAGRHHRHLEFFLREWQALLFALILEKCSYCDAAKSVSPPLRVSTTLSSRTPWSSS